MIYLKMFKRKESIQNIIKKRVKVCSHVFEDKNFTQMCYHYEKHCSNIACRDYIFIKVPAPDEKYKKMWEDLKKFYENLNQFPNEFQILCEKDPYKTLSIMEYIKKINEIKLSIPLKKNNNNAKTS